MKQDGLKQSYLLLLDFLSVDAPFDRGAGASAHQYSAVVLSLWRYAVTSRVASRCASRGASPC